MKAIPLTEKQWGLIIGLLQTEEELLSEVERRDPELDDIYKEIGKTLQAIGLVLNQPELSAEKSEKEKVKLKYMVLTEEQWQIIADLLEIEQWALKDDPRDREAYQRVKDALGAVGRALDL